MLAALGLVALFVLERGLSLWQRGSVPEVVGAEWIWAEGAAETSVPVAFYAVRDFTLGPDQIAPGARVAITAADEYQLFVNGRFLGGGSWMPGSPLDVYDVAGVLQPGGNRIVVELHGFRGAGGLLASLYSDAVPFRLGTDSRWRIVRHARPGLLTGVSPLEPSRPAVSWGAPPTGRWGRVRLASEVQEAPDRPTDPLAPRDAVVWALAKSDRLLCQSRSELLETGGVPDDLQPGKRRCEPLWQIDFAVSSCGFLELEVEGRAQVPYRVWVGEVGQEMPTRPPDEVALLVPGTSRWRSSHAHELSRLWIAGPSDVRGARLRMRTGASAVHPHPDSEGVWGLEPPDPPEPESGTTPARPTSPGGGTGAGPSSAASPTRSSSRRGALRPTAPARS